MTNAEIDRVREMLASSPRPGGLTERRRQLDALGTRYSLPADLRVEAADANGVAAEWTTTPEAEPGARFCFCTAAAMFPDRSTVTAT